MTRQSTVWLTCPKVWKTTHWFYHYPIPFLWFGCDSNTTHEQQRHRFLLVCFTNHCIYDLCPAKESGNNKTKLVESGRWIFKDGETGKCFCDAHALCETCLSIFSVWCVKNWIEAVVSQLDTVGLWTPSVTNVFFHGVPKDLLRTSARCAHSDRAASDISVGLCLI